MIVIALHEDPPAEPHVDLRCADCRRRGFLTEQRLSELRPPLIAVVLCAACFELRDLGGM